MRAYKISPTAAREALSLMHDMAAESHPYCVDGKFDEAAFMREAWSAVVGVLAEISGSVDHADVLPGPLIRAAQKRARRTPR